MSAHLPDRNEIEAVIRLVTDHAREYFATLDERPVRSRDVVAAADALEEGFPETGDGAVDTLNVLLNEAMDAAVHNPGPRFYHFVCGGTTPAALGADLWCTVIDQVAYAWVSSPLAVKLELVSLDWLKQLFGLPREWPGIMVTGATMANFVCLAAARQWWGERHGLDVSETGMGGAPTVPVFSSGYLHASSVKCLSMLGIGRASARLFSRDAIGRLDVEAMEQALKDLNGAPAILVGNAGEVNAGDFDPIDVLADLAERYGCWLHVDGAFGLFAAASPRSRHLVQGVERAQSATVDGHKWLNVPYDAGFAFVSDRWLLTKAFAYSAAYLPGPDDPDPNMGAIGPESSRRARSLAVWATLRAYGRAGVQAMVEQHLDLARYLAECVDEAPDLERLADVPLNIVCFRYNPGDRSEKELNALNARLGEAILEDGRVYAGTTDYGGKTALRPAMVNWRTRSEDIDFFVDTVHELVVQVL